MSINTSSAWALEKKVKQVSVAPFYVGTLGTALCFTQITELVMRLRWESLDSKCTAPRFLKADTADFQMSLGHPDIHLDLLCRQSIPDFAHLQKAMDGIDTELKGGEKPLNQEFLTSGAPWDHIWEAFSVSMC